MNSDGGWFVIALRNQYPMSVNWDPQEMLLSYILVGGLMDFRIFLGSSPLEALRKYHEFNNEGTYIPPFFALGHGVMDKSLVSSAEMLTLAKGMDKKIIPLETVYSGHEVIQPGGQVFTLRKEIDPEQMMVLRK